MVNAAEVSEISGKIKDSQTKEAIIGAIISVKGTIIATSTDNNGAFKFKNQSGASC